MGSCLAVYQMLQLLLNILFNSEGQLYLDPFYPHVEMVSVHFTVGSAHVKGVGGRQKEWKELWRGVLVWFQGENRLR